MKMTRITFKILSKVRFEPKTPCTDYLLRIVYISPQFSSFIFNNEISWEWTIHIHILLYFLFSITLTLTSFFFSLPLSLSLPLSSYLYPLPFFPLSLSLSSPFPFPFFIVFLSSFPLYVWINLATYTYFFPSSSLLPSFLPTHISTSIFLFLYPISFFLFRVI